MHSAKRFLQSSHDPWAARTGTARNAAVDGKENPANGESAGSGWVIQDSNLEPMD